jgi:hypothetical protein
MLTKDNFKIITSKFIYYHNHFEALKTEQPVSDRNVHMDHALCTINSVIVIIGNNGQLICEKMLEWMNFLLSLVQGRKALVVYQFGMVKLGCVLIGRCQKSELPEELHYINFPLSFFLLKVFYLCIYLIMLLISLMGFCFDHEKKHFVMWL